MDFFLGLVFKIKHFKALTFNVFLLLKVDAIYPSLFAIPEILLKQRVATLSFSHPCGFTEM